MHRHRALLPLAALVAVAPLLLGGLSCGLDLNFHLQSWLDAAAQLRQGTLYPRWTFLAAYNSGEPRFTFYPPLSWELGGLLTLVLPFPWVPAAVTWVALTVAGFSMHRLARAWSSANGALLAACLYLANPFMLFTVYRRSAFGELFAAAFCPLLLAALLEDYPTPWALGAPLALIWLCDVPAAILATYLFAFVALLRLARATVTKTQPPLPLFGRFSLGGIVGFGLCAIYLLPALVERPLVRMADAFPAGFHPADNLLLHRILLPGRDDFLIQIAHLVTLLGVVTLLTLALAWWLHRRRFSDSDSWRRTLLLTLITSVTVLLMLTFVSAPLWRTLPALWAVQFPWRLLFILATCAALAIALTLQRLALSSFAALSLFLAIVAALSTLAWQSFRQPCGAADLPAHLQAELDRHHTPEPIDEYVPAHANLGSYRPDNPPFWLAASPTDYAPGTTPNTIDVDPTVMMPQAPPGAKLAATPLHLSLNLARPAILVLNLEDYPHWRVLRNGSQALPHLPRPDGLVALPLPAGPSSIAITWSPGWDEPLGAVITVLTLLACAFTLRRPRHAA